LPGIADTETFLINTWNPLPEIYQQRVYINTLVTVNRQIHQGENPMPDGVIRVEVVCADNAILHDYMTSEVALWEPEIRRTHRNIPIAQVGMDDEVNFGLPGGSGDYYDTGDECNKRNTIPTPGRQ
jgi:hypothetical protein